MHDWQPLTDYAVIERQAITAKELRARVMTIQCTLSRHWARHANKYSREKASVRFVVRSIHCILLRQASAAQ